MGVIARLTWFAKWISLIGDVWFATALIWYWSSTLHQPYILSLLGLAFSLPGILSLFFGVFADRVGGKLLIVSSVWAQALICAGVALAVTDRSRVGLSITLVLIGTLGVLEAIRSNAISVVMSSFISADLRAQFIGLLHSVQSGIQLAARFFAASSLIWLSIQDIALIDCLSFVIAGILYIFLPVPLRKLPSSNEKYFRRSYVLDIIEGWKVIRTDGLSLRLLCVLLLSGPSMAVISGYVAWRIERNLHASSWWYSLSISMEMVGSMGAALLGAKVFRRVARRFGVTWIFLLDFLFMGISAFAMGFFNRIWVIVLCMCLVGVLQAGQNVVAPAYVLASYPKEIIGRAAAVFSTVEAGTQAIGSACMAICAKLLPVPWLFVGAGLLLVVSAPVIFIKLKIKLVTSPTYKNV
ncbi:MULTISPECIES: MFS transporter [Alicyclobacillus]|uniref:Major facilitator superfamily MFS_1 n=2 Tax=Alicyclobacillus acidocaldarius subsp. acidocaldarius TaxID=1388 RepID=C8WWS1_ALIAD|nr:MULTISPECIES: MFS transporter [Alicyclobacillus]ACV58543.1 major facilitator superfamily MFS_1 [Alicyclobacillus acidocaldarius subsp. acidocaldarius DSM 446]